MESLITDYSSLFYLSPFPNWVYDLSTFEILDVNEAAIQYYGYSRKEFLSLSLKALSPKEEKPKLIAAHIDIDSQQGNIFFGVFTHQKKNGEEIRMKINGHKVDFQGKKCVLVVCQDVTEQKESEQHLRKISEQLIECESKFRTIFEIASLGIVQVDPSKGQIILVNSFYETITGYTSEELLKMNFVELTHPDDREKDWELFNRAMRGEVEYRNEKRYIKKDGTVVWVRVHIAFIRNDEGKTIRTVAICEDINSRKEEEQRLKLLESVITNTSDAILITDAESFDEPGPRIIYVNEAFTKMTGYTAEEVIGKTPRILQGPKSDKAELAKLSKAIRNWESCEITTVNYKKNGEEFWINFSVTPVANEKGWFTHWIAVERDVTKQKNEELKKELLGKISLNFRLENDLITSANELCETICSFGKFDFVELWLPNVENTQIQLIANKLSSPKAELFYKYSKDIQSIHLGKGLQGAAWFSKSSILCEDLEKNKDFIRKEAAGKAGIKTALGIPLFWAKQVVGILIIGTRYQINFLSKYLLVFEQLEQFIGSEISRKKLENDLHHLYEAIPDILCLGDLQGRVLKVNKAGCKLLGYEEEELLFHSFDEFVHPDDKDISTNEVLKLGEGQSVFNFENRYLTKNGDIVWLSWTCSSSMEEGLIYATAKNITEEKKLRELNRQVNSMAKIGSWEVDLIRDKLYWSEIVHEIHDTDPKSFVPDLESAINFYREDFREMVQSSVENCIQTGEAFDFEALLVTAKGKDRWVRALGSAEIEKGQCKRIYGGFQDIHEQKIIEHQKISLLTTIEKSLNEIYVFDAETLKFSYVNQGALLNIGYTEDEIKKLTPLDLKPEFNATTFNQLVKPLVTDEKEKIIFFTNHKRKNGSLYPVEVHLQLVAEGNNKRFLAVILDITERKKVEEKLLNAFQEKTNILESIGDAFFSVNKDWMVTYWNKEAEVVLGKKREDIVGRHLWTEYADAVDSDFYHQYHKAIETGETTNFEAYYPTLGKWFEASAYPTPNSLSVYFKDITLRKESDLRLVQANERFEKVTEATNDAIWDWDLENKTFFRSNGIEKFFGENTSKFLVEEDLWKDAYHPEDLALIRQSIKEAIENPDISRWEMEYRILKEDGDISYVVDKGIIIRNKKGRAKRMVGAMTDISERKRHEAELLALNESLKKHAQELELTNEQLEQFAFIASHDLQEPLRMISSFLDQLKRKYGGQLDDKAHQYIHFATDGAKRMKQIILDLLEYSRAGKLEENRVKINFDQLMSDYKSLRKKIILEKSVQIIHPPLLVIDGYLAPFTQVIHCLLDNAIKYSRDGVTPRIELGVEESKSEWVFSVRDNGLGIAPEFFDKIFIIFQRLHNRNQYDGNGIGLSIVKKQVESWGGKVWLESIPGEGSVFFFTQPKNY
jgi:PAS domain S-box-containing protein